jgi:pimeloyl-ACP methyl ester carboxylesterase
MRVNKLILGALVIAGLGLVSGLIGAIVSGVYTVTYPTFGANWVDTWQPMVWPCMFLALFSVCLIHLVTKPMGDVHKAFWFQVVFWSVCALAALVNAIGLFVGHMPNGGGWYLAVVVVCVACVAVLLYRNRTSAGCVPRDETLLDTEETVLKDKHVGKCAKVGYWTGIVLLYLLLAIAFIFLILNCYGTWVLAAGVLAYPPPGQITTTQAATTGLAQDIHWQCLGFKQPGQPTIVFESDGSHGVTDFYCLFESLAAKGKRVCIWDKPGLGWSSPIQSGQDFFSVEGMSQGEAQYLSALPVQDRDPLVMIGWGGGGANVFSYASRHQDKVKALGFIDVYPPNFEWNPANPSYKPGEKEQALAQRLSFMAIIRGLGVPSGLVSLFTGGDSTYRPANKAGVQRWTYNTGKTWTAQAYYMLNPAFANDLNWTAESVGNIPLLNMITQWNTTTVEQNNYWCKTNGVSSTECQQAIASNTFAVSGKEALTSLGGTGSKSVGCTEYACNQGSLVYGNEVCNLWTAEQISEFVDGL